MNTYTITYYPPGSTAAAPPITVQAADFASQDDFAVEFYDDATPPNTVLCIPLALNPIIQRTATA